MPCTLFVGIYHISKKNHIKLILCQVIVPQHTGVRFAKRIIRHIEIPLIEEIIEVWKLLKLKHIPSVNVKPEPSDDQPLA